MMALVCPRTGEDYEMIGAGAGSQSDKNSSTIRSYSECRSCLSVPFDVVAVDVDVRSGQSRAVRLA